MKQTEGRKSKKVYEPIVDLDGEVWKDVVGYEGLYQVSNKGRIKSLNYRGHRGVIKLFVPHKNRSGYLTVYLTKGDKRQTKMIHRLVYEAFIGDLPKCNLAGKGYDRLEINHKDENPSNNCIDNLELITHIENVNYGTAIQRRTITQTNGKKSKKVYQYSRNGELVKIWESANECNRNGFSLRNVAACCLGRKNSCYGFIWSYKPLTAKECLNIKSRENGKVYQFTLDGELVKIWNNAGACDKHGFNSVCVRLCCLEKQYTHKGYIWSFHEISKEDAEHIKHVIQTIKEDRRKKIYQYSLNHELVMVWESGYECEKNGFCKQNIKACCSGKRKTHKGYIWSYIPLFGNN